LGREINSLHRHQNSYLCCDLNHPSISRQARSKLTQSGGAVAFHWMRILRPLGHSKSGVLRRRHRMWHGQFDEYRLTRLASEGGHAAESSLQPHVVQSQRVRDRIYAILAGQFDRSLPQWLRQLRPVRSGAAKLIQLALQLHDRLRDR
jgi:hypothetical protein